jgi:hypothetical protein
MISKYVRRGLPVRDDGLIDWPAAKQWFDKNVCPPRSGSYQHDERMRAARSGVKPANGKPADQTAVRTNGGQADRANPGHAVAVPVGTLVDLQRQKLAIENQRRQLDLLRERAEVVPVGLINAFVAAMIVRCRERLSRLPGELKDRFDVLTGQQCAELLAAEIDAILDSLRTFPLPGETPNLRPADTKADQ